MDFFYRRSSARVYINAPVCVVQECATPSVEAKAIMYVLPNLDARFSFHFLVFVVVVLFIVMDGDGSSNAVAGPSTLPDVIPSFLPPPGMLSHRT